MHMNMLVKQDLNGRLRSDHFLIRWTQIGALVYALDPGPDYDDSIVNGWDVDKDESSPNPTR